MKREECLGIVNKMIADGIITQDDAAKYFPELAESEDEKIRKALMQNLKERFGTKGSIGKGLNMPDVLAWFEKQGKQTPAKVEPEFKVGDWVVNTITNSVEQIIYVTNNEYICSGTLIVSFDNQHLLKKWAIEDAKDGDILCTYECDEPKIVFILKGTPKKHYALSYHCYYNIMYPHFESYSERGCLAPNDKDIKPATKEQSDTLFAVMKEIGCEWDVEKKELKTIEKNPTWNEDIEAAISIIKHIAGEQEIDNHPHNANNLRKAAKYLETYRHQFAWKPSAAQIDALKFYIEKGFIDKEGCFGKCIVKLYEQLKKLIEN